VRDSSFTIYALLRMGFRSEAAAYMDFISSILINTRDGDGGIPIMTTIRGSTEIPERELGHLSGYRNSGPVRIGNGAATHTQHDIYGELADAVYVYNRLGAPVSYDGWCGLRRLADHAARVWRTPDMSIWEVRGTPQRFVYSQMMLWVALDRAIRLADKRCFPCPERERWRATRDEIYEAVMDKGYNQTLGAFVQSFEANDVLDSAVLIAPLVFFIAPNDPRFQSTLDQILRPPEKGGLMSAGLLYRYNWMKSDDGKLNVRSQRKMTDD
jgi:GH15 family glucan-1,4-alpha-glucosidase